MSLASEFRSGIAHMNANVDTEDQLWPVARAIASRKVHYLGLLRASLHGVSLHSRRFFCSACPSLQPASGGVRVEYVDPEHPAWDLLRTRFSVETVPGFLKHLVNRHEGEARLIGEAAWAPLQADVCNPAFWPCYFARTDRSRRWLARWNPTEWLSLQDVQ